MTVILATASKKAQELRGEGDATAAKLYSDAFAQQPEFFSFIRSMKAKIASKLKYNMMILKPGSDFFRFMQSPQK
ncbi:HflC protein [Canicola haemoglobinophilus]|uniref:HflC protein n=1 Tax=Canicola haemoglobinophilus TaxID=733 RepID=A0AB38HBQ0_9PAST|nr:HflC protein [Canicola haemoglobinophilus]